MVLNLLYFLLFSLKKNHCFILCIKALNALESSDACVRKQNRLNTDVPSWTPHIRIQIPHESIVISDAVDVVGTHAYDKFIDQP